MHRMNHQLVRAKLMLQKRTLQEYMQYVYCYFQVLLLSDGILQLNGIKDKLN